MFRSRVTICLLCVTNLVLLVSAPASLAESYHRGQFYLFSQAFWEHIPRRLTGFGRFRFVLQPLVAIILGIRSGTHDAREGRPPYLYAIVFRPDLRNQFLRSGIATVINLLLMGILMDAVFQWIILGTSHPAAALIVGPVLILGPYSVARALANRGARLISPAKTIPHCQKCQ